MLRRRGFRGRGRGRGRALLGHLRDRPELGLRDLRALDLPPSAPTGLELGHGQTDGQQNLGLVVAQWEGPALLGWARVVTLLAERGPLTEVVVAAPAIGGELRRMAQQWPAALPTLRLLALPVLAESPEEPVTQEVFPFSGDLRPRVSPARTVLDRVLQVVEGGVALTGVGELREAGEGFVLYMRGTLVLQLVAEGSGVAVTFVEPEKRQFQVQESNFPRWGVDLHEHVVRLAQDPRLLNRPEAAVEEAVDRIAARFGVRVTARWLPWSQDGSAPIEWAAVAAVPALRTDRVCDRWYRLPHHTRLGCNLYRHPRPPAAPRPDSPARRRRSPHRRKTRRCRTRGRWGC